MSRANLNLPFGAPPRQSRKNPGQLVCGCKRGHASSRDGLCTLCRGGSYLDMQRANDPLRSLGFEDCEVTNGQ